MRESVCASERMRVRDRESKRVRVCMLVPCEIESAHVRECA